jgi:hypothetical protein
MEPAMVFAKKRPLGEFHASLREVDAGLFQAEYSGEINPQSPDAREIPDVHLGTSVAEVKVWVEQMAKDLGYTRVVWDVLPDSMR